VRGDLAHDLHRLAHERLDDVGRIGFEGSDEGEQAVHLRGERVLSKDRVEGRAVTAAAERLTCWLLRP
jgi:hypothetical protein